ncbi:MAG TPA: hypothetical protein VGD48_26360, partial [Kutzneria sp.]
MRTLVKVLPVVPVLAAAIACGALLGSGVAAARSADIAQCLRDHGVDTSGVTEYPNGIYGVPGTGPKVQQ